jgi:hypothetical protein
LDSPLVHLAGTRTFVQIVDARARSFLLLNRPAEAWRELSFMNDFRRCLDSNACDVVTTMLDIAVAGLFISDIELGYSMSGWKESQWLEMQAKLESLDLLRLLRYGIEAERATNLRIINYKNEALLELTSKQALAWEQYWPEGWYAQNKLLVAQSAQAVLDAINVQEARIDRQPLRTYNAKFIHVFDRITPKNIFAALRIPNYVTAMATVTKTQTRANLAACAFALERYRVKYGQYPEKLEALAPEFKAKVPHDIVNGEPLKYRREAPDRFILYSIGWDLKDDGGKEADNKGSGDWVWTSSL